MSHSIAVTEKSSALHGFVDPAVTRLALQLAKTPPVVVAPHAQIVQERRVWVQAQKLVFPQIVHAWARTSPQPPFAYARGSCEAPHIQESQHRRAHHAGQQI
eukprot:CAMPEP_0184560322 /NCGR_PEP_ID=MMETSP0199_2-20130426/46874_1 /TAXON_ID=1112570 /ORGANISM="Thraustochytrium sp., Strain LLF1b" /LENGTH=101 /DNA_ID=CAMNT_0026957623 /DNA_START=1228 /DNA_END=1533 /DNA_ORIENTATION=-